MPGDGGREEFHRRYTCKVTYRVSCVMYPELPVPFTLFVPVTYHTVPTYSPLSQIANDYLQLT